jgi:hypothetical protein
MIVHSKTNNPVLLEGNLPIYWMRKVANQEMKTRCPKNTKVVLVGLNIK